MTGELGTLMPQPHFWLRKSNVWHAKRDAILCQVDRSLENYNLATPLSKEEVEALSELYFSLDFWLKEAQRGSKQVATTRTPLIMELYSLVVGKLASTTGVTVNLLPRWLEETFGKGMVQHGYKKDFANREAQYLTPEQVKKYRIEFKDGVAYQQSWWLNSPRLVKADTLTPNPGRDAAGKTMLPGHHFHQGFVLSMSRDFYMMQHYTPKGETKETGRFHSSYFAGESILCAGTVHIEDGKFKAVTTASGHYAPGMSHLYNAVSTLAMMGVDLESVMAWVYDQPKQKAADVLQNREFMPEEAAARFKRERAVGLGFVRQAQVDAGVRALQTKANVEKEKIERAEHVAHFSILGHNHNKCKVCELLKSRGLFAELHAAYKAL